MDIDALIEMTQIADSGINPLLLLKLIQNHTQPFSLTPQKQQQPQLKQETSSPPPPVKPQLSPSSQTPSSTPPLQSQDVSDSTLKGEEHQQQGWNVVEDNWGWDVEEQQSQFIEDEQQQPQHQEQQLQHQQQEQQQQQQHSSIVEEEQQQKKKSVKNLKYNLRRVKSEPSTPLETILTTLELTPKIISKTVAKKRQSKKRVVFASTTKWIPKRPKTAFNDLILSTVDTATYHSLIIDENQDAKKLLSLADKTKSSQLDRFVYADRSYILLSWLTVVRIFEYDTNQYLEVKRLPERYVELAPHLITSVHHNDSKFYIAYLWGNPDNCNKGSKPYIEMRDIHGKLLQRPVFYDQIIKTIYSDSNYIYAKTCDGKLYIHDKIFLNCSYHCVDFSLITDSPLIGTWVESTDKNTYTKLKLLSATTNEILVTHYDVLCHSVYQCYRFDDEQQYKIVSFDKVDKLIVVHRNSVDSKNKCKSRLEFGFMACASANSEETFIHESTMIFNSYISQVKIHKDRLYLFGHTINKQDNSPNYEIGCLYLPSMKPLWIRRLDEVTADAHILPHESNVAIVKDKQQITCIGVPKDSEIKFECKRCNLKFLVKKDRTVHDDGVENIFSKLIATRNAFLDEVGASIFTKLPPLNKAMAKKISCG